MTLLFYWPRVAFRRAAYPLLQERFTQNQVRALWQRVLVQQAELKSERPQHSLGVNFLLRYMEWDCALYKVLLDQNIPAAQAGEWVEQVNWQIFAPAVATGFAVSRLRSASRIVRVRWLVDMLFRLLFTSPFQRHVKRATDSVEFEVSRCPLVEYFSAQGLAGLTPYAACSLDHRMAELWGVDFQRNRTIAKGSATCDFQFKSIPIRSMNNEL